MFIYLGPVRELCPLESVERWSWSYKAVTWLQLMPYVIWVLMYCIDDIYLKANLPSIRRCCDCFHGFNDRRSMSCNIYMTRALGEACSLKWGGIWIYCRLRLGEVVFGWQVPRLNPRRPQKLRKVLVTSSTLFIKKFPSPKNAINCKI